MAHTFTRLYFHIIFSTKHRQPLIDSEFEERLHPYLGGIIREMGGVAIRVGGVADHVHLLAQLPATLALADVVRDIKSNSSGWVHETFSGRAGFAWQTGYGGFAVSKSKLPDLDLYSACQKEYHAKESYETELIRYLDNNEVEYDERFVLD
ncbi:MAG: IS200/IS605 family transposase [Pirellulaceae bacterium]